MKSSDILTENRPHSEKPPLFNVVLVEPEIPQNTGNIGRTCVGTRSHLHIVGKTGFDITDKNLKRAGLDYWQYLHWIHHPDMESWQKSISDSRRVFYFTTKAEKTFYDVEFKQGDWLVFGKETKGLDEEILRQNRDQMVKIPILGPIRSLNVATAVTVVLYEAIRQLKASGHMLEDGKAPDLKNKSTL
jgi:tRNA (cytidine/uridine-2'-O-)-methyltransferase